MRTRKAETRQKIQLGGLIVKAKMDKYSKDVILGALTEAAEGLEAEEAGLLKLYKAKGEAAFMKTGEE